MEVTADFVPLSSLAFATASGKPLGQGPVSQPSRQPQRDFKTLELAQKRDFILTSLEIGLSSNCNFRCDYCCAYNLNDKNLMTSGRVIEILEDVPTLERVKLSGGEVLIYFDECVRVIEYCAARGLQTQVNTNGSLLNRQKIARLEAAGLGCLHVSYNFVQANDFSTYYRQKEEMFFRIEENIRLLAASEIELVAETVMFRSTQGQLPEVHRRLYELGARKHEIQNGIPIQKNDWAEVLSRADVEEEIANLVANRHPEMKLYFSCVDIDPHGTFYPKVIGYLADGQIHFPSCIEGRNQLHIHSNGDVLICELGHPKVIANLNGGAQLQKLLDERPPLLVDFLERRNTDACSCTIRTLVQPSVHA